MHLIIAISVLCDVNISLFTMNELILLEVECILPCFPYSFILLVMLLDTQMFITVVPEILLLYSAFFHVRITSLFHVRITSLLRQCYAF